MEEKDIDVQFEDGTLCIRGERSLASPEGGRALRRERGVTRFARTLALGEQVNQLEPPRTGHRPRGARELLEEGILELAAPALVHTFN